MTIQKIMKPIKDQRKTFEKTLNAFVDSVKNDRVRENYRVFFEHQGKHLRPSLLFLACNAVSKGDIDDDKVMKLALILELLHSASLIHDDIIDGDNERRGHKTVNSIFGNKVGVLAGDTLFSYAFSLATQTFDSSYNNHITSLALSMCEAELIQANGVDSKASYLEVIYGKTALFMSVACRLGAMIGGGTEKEVDILASYGLNLGMTYQIIDDFVDNDVNALKYVEQDEAQKYYEEATSDLNKLSDSDSRQSMFGLLNYVIKMKA